MMNKINWYRLVMRVFFLGIIFGINFLIPEKIPYFLKIFYIDVLILGLMMVIVLDIQEAEDMKQ